MKNLHTSSIQELFEKALFFCQTHQLKKAKSIYQGLIKNFPTNTIVLTNLGSIELLMGNFEQGTVYLEKSIEIDENQPNAINNLANGLYELNDYDQALVKIKLIEHLDFVDAHYNKGRILKSLNRFDEALETYSYVLKLDPCHVQAIINKGLIYAEKKQYKEALKAYQEVIQINPNYAEAYYNCGLIYAEIKQYKEALKAYKEAIQIKPNYAEAYCNLGILFNSDNNQDSALKSLEKAIQINPNYAEAYYNCGVIYDNLKKYDDAIKVYKKAVQINPNYVEAFLNLALIQVNLKSFKEGWINFEKRLLLDQYKINHFNYLSRELNLNLIKISKKVLVINEQGIGDQILYLSMLPNLAEFVSNIDVLVDGRLINLLKRSFPKINFMATEAKIEVSIYDIVLPMGNLGKIFRNSNEDFCKYPMPYLKSDLSKVSFTKVSSKKLCGISWKSKNDKIGENKSINLEVLLPILNLPNLDFVCLQYGEVDDDIKYIENTFKIKIKKIEGIDIFNDIDGLTSAISKVDLVITTSNINAHLAGGLGKETYLLVPYSTGKLWYWHEDDKQSIWYPSVLIYRQSNTKSWQKPINEIINNLRGKLID